MSDRADQDGVACVLGSSNDMEVVATWFNAGFDAAVAQGLADDPLLAEDWLAEHDARVRITALEAAQAVIAGEDSVEFTRPQGGMISSGYAIRLIDDLIEETKEDLE